MTSEGDMTKGGRVEVGDEEGFVQRIDWPDPAEDPEEEPFHDGPEGDERTDEDEVFDRESLMPREYRDQEDL